MDSICRGGGPYFVQLRHVFFGKGSDTAYHHRHQPSTTSTTWTSGKDTRRSISSSTGSAVGVDTRVLRAGGYRGPRAKDFTSHAEDVH